MGPVCGAVHTFKKKREMRNELRAAAAKWRSPEPGCLHRHGTTIWLCDARPRRAPDALDRRTDPQLIFHKHMDGIRAEPPSVGFAELGEFA